MNEKDLIFKVATSKSDIEKAQHLAWRIYGQELKYFDPKKNVPKLHTDEYDPHSLHVIAEHHGEIVGSLRLILDSEIGFYIEKDFQLKEKLEDRKHTGEISRLIVLPEHRGGARLISMGLLKKTLEVSKNNAVSIWLAVMNEGLKTSFEKSAKGIVIKPLAFLSAHGPQAEKIRSRMPGYYKSVDPRPYIIDIAHISL